MATEDVQEQQNKVQTLQKELHLATPKVEEQETKLTKLNETLLVVEKNNVILLAGTKAGINVPSLKKAIKLLRKTCFLRQPPEVIQELVHTIMNACTLPGGSKIILK